MAEGIRTGAVRLGDSPDAVTVDTPDELTLEIELETEDDEMSLEHHRARDIPNCEGIFTLTDPDDGIGFLGEFSGQRC
ncbi:amphi-Trp domain-containing protein [Haloarchaeobius sp. DYHT-AS-18]|uniref:amphi-Trp domain-containing protein n=1 Tax=Haloarchaeobius sp. DYHT-AS-18 TaxID=3446117 RepID=UPI003EBDB7B0